MIFITLYYPPTDYKIIMLTSHYFPTQTLKTLINTELFVILLVDK